MALYVLSTSPETATRHAALEPDVWFSTEAEARDWLAGCDASMRRLFRVYEVTPYGAREPLTVAGIAARFAAVAASFAVLFVTVGIGSSI